MKPGEGGVSSVAYTSVPRKPGGESEGETGGFPLRNLQLRFLEWALPIGSSPGNIMKV